MKKNLICKIATALTILTAVPASFAADCNTLQFPRIKVQVHDIFNNTTESCFPGNQTSSITINVNSVTTRVNVWHEAASAGDLPELRISGPGTNNILLVLGASNTSGTNEPPQTPACGDLNGIVGTHAGLRLYGRIDGDLTKTINISKLQWLAINGVARAGIQGNNGTGVLQNVDVGAIASNGNITFPQGFSRDIRIFGNCSGPISVPGGIRKGEIGGNLGSTITVANDALGDVINEFLIQGSVLSSGAIHVKDMKRLAINGNLAGEIEMTGGILGASDYIRVGESLLSTGLVTVPSSGLTGQITFNNNDSASTWQGDVIVGGVTLSPTGYAETAVSLGDGATGIVPFGLHAVSCDPVDDGNMGLPSSDPFNIRHYGPVGKSTKGNPVTVKRKVAGSAATATDHTAGFSYLIDGTGNHLLKASLASGYVYLSGYEYIVEPVTTGVDRLFCIDAVGTPGVDGYEYTFTVGTCPADINGDGTIDTADLGILINNFGLSALSIPGDLNNDTNVDTADLGILISLFGETCGIPAAAMAGGGGGLSASALLQELGFSSVEGYTTWLESLSEQQCVDHICTLMEMVEEH